VTSSVQNHCSRQQRSGQVSRVPSDLTCRSGHSARRSVLWACRSRVTISYISEQSYKARPTNGRSGQPQKGMEPARKPWDTELAQWGVGAARGDTGNDQPDRPALQKPARSGMAQSGEEDGSPRRRRCTTWSIFFFFFLQAGPLFPSRTLHRHGCLAVASSSMSLPESARDRVPAGCAALVLRTPCAVDRPSFTIRPRRHSAQSENKSSSGQSRCEWSKMIPAGDQPCARSLEETVPLGVFFFQGGKLTSTDERPSPLAADRHLHRQRPKVGRSGIHFPWPVA